MFLDENIYEIIDQLSVTLLTYIDGQRIVVQHKKKIIDNQKTNGQARKYSAQRNGLLFDNAERCIYHNRQTENIIPRNI